LFIDRVYGYFEFRRPTVIITDPKIVKQLAVKEFDNFQDHRVVLNEEIDPILGSMLTMLTGQKWKGENVL
jgi:cytochrome P450 family 9